MLSLPLLRFPASACSVSFDVAHQPYFTTVVRADQLIEGNGKLEASSALAAVAGPGLAGWLVTLLGAPVAIALDALSFIGSAFLLGQVRRAKHVPLAGPDQRSMVRDRQEGLHMVLRHEVLRPLAIFSAMCNFFGKVVEVSLILIATRTLGLSAALLGLLFSAEDLGGLIGAALPGWSLRRYGLGRTLVVSTGGMGAASLLFPLASGSVWVSALLLGSGLLAPPGVVERGVPGAATQPAPAPDIAPAAGPHECQHALPSLGVGPLGASCRSCV